MHTKSCTLHLKGNSFFFYFERKKTTKKQRKVRNLWVNKTNEKKNKLTCFLKLPIMLN